MRRAFLLGVRLAAVALVCFIGVAQADVRLPSLISDNMALQQDMPVPIWGWADPGEKVTVKVGDKEATATADDKGKWMVKLEPLKAGGPMEMTVTGKNAITVKNILVGEVWLASGQSNMAMALAGCNDAQAAIAAANYPNLRLFQAALTPAGEPQEDVKGQWRLCSPESAPGFSAAAYFFGRDLHKELNVPVGMIQSAWGGTVAQAWTSLPALEAVPELKPMADQFKDLCVKYPDLQKNYIDYYQKWAKEEAAFRKAMKERQAAVEKAKAEGKPAPPADPALKPPTMPGSRNTPSVLYNGMIAPLVPVAIRGAIWYQGEGNAGAAYQYRTLFPTMIKCWRDAWGQGDFAFVFVQLPNYMAVAPEPGESRWAEIREAFLMSLSVPNTAMAVTIDIGDEKDIHPKNKEDVGKRLAIAALGTVYGKKIVYSGPIYDTMAVEGNAVRLKFKHVGGGLVAKGGEALKCFAIAGEDKKFVWADARIDGETVVVSSDKVAKPVAVRYAWADNPEGCNLYNKEGLPASPFRTDEWPGITAPKR